MMNKYEDNMTELEMRVKNLSESNQDLKEKKLLLESKERDLTNKLKLSEKEVDSLTRDIEYTRNDNKNLDGTKFT